MAVLLGGFEALHPGVEGLGLMHVERLIGAEGGEDFGGQPRRRRWPCGREVVGRIVGGADGFDVEFAEDALGAQVVGGERCIGRSQMRSARRFVEQLVDTEIALQFEVGPVIERIAQSVSARSAPMPGTFRRGRRRRCNSAHRRRWRAWRAIYSDRLRARFRTGCANWRLAGDVVRRQMAVVVEDRLGFRIFVVEAPGGFVAQQKIFMNKGHGGL